MCRACVSCGQFRCLLTLNVARSTHLVTGSASVALSFGVLKCQSMCIQSLLDFVPRLNAEVRNVLFREKTNVKKDTFK